MNDENEISITQNTGKERQNLITQGEDIITIQKARKNIVHKSDFYEKKLLKNSGNINSVNNSLNINKSQELEEKNDTFNIDDDFFAKDGCTALTLGLEPMPQKCYICPICDITKKNYICNYCYIFCHEKCRNFEGNDSPKSKEENNFLGQREFACYCGNILKHKINKIPKVLIMPCSMTQLDDTLEVNLFFCKNHYLVICGVCSVECHKKCKIVKHKVKNNEMSLCKCTDEKHTIYNDVGLMFNLDKYKKKTGVKFGLCKY